MESGSGVEVADGGVDVVNTGVERGLGSVERGTERRGRALAWRKAAAGGAGRAFPSAAAGVDELRVAGMGGEREKLASSQSMRRVAGAHR